MSTGYEVTRGAVDWWSRWMALGSLIVAGATIVWSYSQFRNQPTRETIVGLIHQRASELERQESQARSQRELANQKLIADVRTEARTVFDEHQKLIRDMSALKGELTQTNGQANKISDIAAADTNVTKATHEESPLASDEAASEATDSAAADTDAVAGTAQPVDGKSEVPHLVNEQIVLRPSSANTAAPGWRLQSRSKVGARIRGMEFTPTEIIDIPETVTLDAVLATPPEVCRIVLTSADNKASKPGHQGKYVRTLDEPYHIPGTTSRELLVVIDDPSHAGYGLRGRLAVYYDGPDPVVIDDFSIAFAATKPANAGAVADKTEGGESSAEPESAESGKSNEDAAGH